MQSFITIDPGCQGSFDIVGTIGELPVFAVRQDRLVHCSRELWQRARQLVDRGESFSYAGSPTEVQASLEGSLVAMFLTLVRACDRIDRTEFSASVEAMVHTAYSLTLSA